MGRFRPTLDGGRRATFRATPLGTRAETAKVTVPEGDPVEAVPPEKDPAYVDELIEKARQAGRAEALAELRPEIEILEQTIAALGPALDDLARLRREVLEQAAEDVGQIILGICGRVLDEAFSTQPQAVARVVTDAVAQLPEAEDVRIAVPPGILEHVTRNVDQRFRSSIVPDDSIGQGCVIRTRYVTLDATLDSALAGVEAAVREWVGVQPWSHER